MRSRVAVAGIATALFVGSFGAGSASAFRDKDCDDFATQAKAQKFFKKHSGPKKDPHGLDADHDGIACEDLP